VAFGLNPYKRFYGIKDDFREPFERDRDRILHCASFRRLEYKTQVFINSDGDNFRTRLTHSLEVSQIARTLAKKLGLDSTLAEAIALAHDLGHTPFGHIGGDALDDALKAMGSKNGFEHNYQSFRVLSSLEKRYDEFNGLNLTFGVLEGVLKHSAPYYKPFLSEFVRDNFCLDKHPSAEALIVDLADSIAYLSSDVEDALCNGIISIDKLKQNEFCTQVLDEIFSSGTKQESEVLRYKISTKIITIMVSDILNNSKESLQSVGKLACAKLDASLPPVVSFSPNIQKLSKELKSFLTKHVYWHESVLIRMAFGERVIKSLFEAYMSKPKMLPIYSRDKIGKNDNKTHRLIADYIASLSDRTAIETYRKLF
jgi:dGTPase